MIDKITEPRPGFFGVTTLFFRASGHD